MLDKSFIENPLIFSINKEDNRAYYLPCKRTKNSTIENNNESFIDLNGKWNFSFIDAFYKWEYNTKFSHTISVPANWQMQGYDTHQYLNTRYPFTYDPPFIPTNNPVGYYQRDIDIELEEDSRYFVNFEGVDSAYYLILNGSFVGYNQISHCTGEFEITKYLKSGNNDFRVVVLKWCDGSYLECQDKFRMSGIFRNVYILKRPANFVFDYFIKSTFAPDFSKCKLEINFTLYGDLPNVNITLKDKDFILETQNHNNPKTILFEINNPKLWNCEAPNLYTIEISTPDETITEKYGLRKIEVIGNEVLLNGKPIKFLGVNRHDSYPDTGYSCTIAQMKNDLKIMKEHNINSIRTSHYPNSPEFTKLCDEYGFYVIQEADIECHGVMGIHGAYEMEHFNLIANDIRFNDQIVERVMRMVERDKNRPSILIWSLGNESGYGKNFKLAAEKLKQRDKTRLLHYEATYLVDDKDKHELEIFDVDSMMYPDILKLKERLETSQKNKPLIVCECCHAMGNGPGDLKDLYNLTFRNKNFGGAFVWEFCDHAILQGTQNGKEVYHYGGDFGEKLHDGNFCMDGLVFPDRTPHTGLLELKEVIKPIQISYINGEFKIENRYNFSNLKVKIDVSYEIMNLGNILHTGDLDKDLLDLDPGENRRFNLRENFNFSDETFIKFIYKNKISHPLLAKEHVIGFDFIKLADKKESFTTDKIINSDSNNEKQIEIAEDAQFVRVYANGISLSFDKTTVMPVQLYHNDENILKKDTCFNLYRAPTDNDVNINKKWISLGLDRLETKVYELFTKIENNNFVLNAKISLGAPSVANIALINIRWIFTREGSLCFDSNIKISEFVPFLPRIGVRFFIDKNFEDVEYYGYGPRESYLDKYHYTYKDIFNSKVSQMHEDYIRPQENGSHKDCDYVRLSSQRKAVKILGDCFYFNVSPYTQEELSSKTHNYLLQESGMTVLCIDYMQSGLGSNSCGPELMDRYKLNDKNIDFKFVVQIYDNGY